MESVKNVTKHLRFLTSQLITAHLAKSDLIFTGFYYSTPRMRCYTLHNSSFAAFQQQKSTSWQFVAEPMQFNPPIQTFALTSKQYYDRLKYQPFFFVTTGNRVLSTCRFSERLNWSNQLMLTRHLWWQSVIWLNHNAKRRFFCAPAWFFSARFFPAVPNVGNIYSTFIFGLQAILTLLQLKLTRLLVNRRI